MRATTTPMYIPVPTVMARAAMNRALLELIPALEKSPFALALPVCQNKNREWTEPVCYSSGTSV